MIYLKLTVTCGQVKPHHWFQPQLSWLLSFLKRRQPTFYFGSLTFYQKRNWKKTKEREREKLVAILNSWQVYHQSFMNALSKKVYHQVDNKISLWCPLANGDLLCFALISVLTLTLYFLTHTTFYLIGLLFQTGCCWPCSWWRTFQERSKKWEKKYCFC